jgi:branched-chain amino acid transport system permease protein
MEYFLQQLINGITLGSIYGLIAIGYTMVYGIIGMINFAHGDVFMVGSVAAFLVVLGMGLTGGSGLLLILLSLIIVAVIAMVVASAYNWTIERARLQAVARLLPAGTR